jgi:CubicO group peptidase (beta-lactamase class C family)
MNRRRVYTASVLVLTGVLAAGARQPPTPPLDATASDPVAMKWMTGQPVPADRLVQFADGSFVKFPQSRWAFSHFRQLVPTAVVRRGDGPVAMLPRRERADIDTVTFTPLGGQSEATWAQSLSANYTDGILILHKGHVVYERYFGVLAPDRQHIAFSVTKSIVATLARTLMAEGTIDEAATVGRYVPELASSGLGNATIRQVLDMTTAPAYTEVYTDPQSDVWQLSRAGGFLPRPLGYQGPASFFDYLVTVKQASPHGERFVYKTINTDVLAFVVRRVTGRSLSEALHERIFRRLGPEQDAYFAVDPTGVEFAGGGLNLTLRDLARFGEMMRLSGRFNGQQIVPDAVVADIRRGASRERFAGAGYQTLPGWSYRNMWWVSHNPHGAYMARGIHGQALYIDPTAEMVIARFASHHIAGNVGIDPMSLPAYEAVARHLMTTRR